MPPILGLNSLPHSLSRSLSNHIFEALRFTRSIRPIKLSHYHLSASSIIQDITDGYLKNLCTMAKKRKRNPSPQSEASSDLSTFSRSPTPPKSWSSSPSAPTIGGSVEPPARVAKRRKVNKPRLPASHRQTRQSSGPRLISWAWMDPKSDEWDVLRVINSECCLAEDPLLKLPSPKHTYIDTKGKLKDPDKYLAHKLSISKLDERSHPKLQAHIDNGTVTPALRAYYQAMPHDHCLPISGVIREPKFEALFGDHILTNTVYQEDAFHARPSIKLVIPDHLKAILVDDWENVTKNQQLVPLPSAHPVNSILADYLAFEKPKRIPGSAQADILEEIVAGLKEYFEKCLGRILLYR